MRRGAAAVLLAVAAGGVALAAGGRQPLELVERDLFLMGTRAHLETFRASRQAGLDALSRALGTLESTEAELSNWRADSWIARFNRRAVGDAIVLTPTQCRMFAAVARAVSDTGGAFDPALGALIDAWGLRRSGAVPDAATRASALARTGWTKLRFEEDACRLARAADVSIDTGAFGKGEALDRVAAGDPGPWLIDLGGQIAVRGTPPGQAGWVVAIADPRDRGRALFDVRLTDGSLATSGASERDLTVGPTRIGHILDPRTGSPAAFDGSVAVWHQSALTADMLSTALYVMGPADGLAWARKRNLAVCYLVPLPSGRVDVRSTPQFDRLVVGRRPQ
jgi:thiamine biosynthesis lipoprotein